MARKKKEEESDASAPTPEKKTTRRRRKADEVPVEVEVEQQPEGQAEAKEEKPAKRTRRRKSAEDLNVEVEVAESEEPAKEDKPKPKRTRRRATAKTTEEAESKPQEPQEEEEKPKRRTTRTRAKKAETKEEEKPEETKPAPKTRTRRTTRAKSTPAKSTEEKEEAKPKTRTSTRRTKKDETKEPARSASTSADKPLVPVWRARTDAPKEAEDAKQPQPSAEEEDKKAPRRSRTRRRKDREDADISAAAAFRAREEADTEKEERKDERKGRERTARARKEAEKPPKEQKPSNPFAKPREPISVPEDAPQVAMINGHPTLVREKQVYPPIMFFASAMNEQRLNNVLEQVRLAADNGVNLVSILVELEVNPDQIEETVKMVGYLVSKIVEANPDAQVILRTTFAAPDGWRNRFPKSVYKTQDGDYAEPSVCDDEFWDVAERCLSDVVAKVRQMDVAKHIMGVHLERGEWFIASGTGYDTSTAATEKFREWLRLRYRNDFVTLRAAWFQGDLTFENVKVPPYKTDHQPGEKFVRTGRKSRSWVDYHMFLSDSTVQRIDDLAYAAKKASNGRFLVGASYGYTFEWSHPGSGHLSVGKLLRSSYVDYIGGPPSYRDRKPGGSCPFPGPIDSLALNGKLYISEEDFKTPISGHQEPDDFNPVMKTPQSLESVHWRGAGAALAHDAGISWMDTWGNGWLSSPGIWRRAGAIRDAMIRRLAWEQAPADVAVFVDERSLAYLVDQRAFTQLVQNVRESVLRAGLTSSFFLLSDLAHRESFPDSKLYVFINAWDMRPEVRSGIKNRLQGHGKHLFWLYAAGLFEGGRESLERVREATGIPLRPQPFNSKPGTTLLNRRQPLCEALPEEEMRKGGHLEPSYFAIPEQDGIVLGEYTQTGLPSFVIKPFQGENDDPKEEWTSIFLGEPIVTPGLFRALGQMAGAHVWNFQDDVVHVREPFLTVHCHSQGPRTVTLPDKWSAYDLNAGEWSAVEGNSLRFQGFEGSSHAFLVGMRADLESLLQKPLDDLIQLDEVPTKPENTLKTDSVLFDVPIMKLNDWVEEGWTETMADDLMLKSTVGQEPEPEPKEKAEERRSRRRRRNRGGRGEQGGRGQGNREQKDTSKDRNLNDLGSNIVFRKRD
jgi:hypothetical protein